LVSLAVAGALLLTACGDDEEKPSPVPTPAPTSASPSASASPNPQSSVEGALLDRYELYVRTYEKVLATADPNVPELRTVAIGPQYQNVVGLALGLRARKEVARGRINSNPRVSSVETPKRLARLEDCQNSNAVTTYDSVTGRVKYPATPRPSRIVLVEMRLLMEQWFVYSTTLGPVC